ncbi:glycoside hydrolase family 18 protein [Virgibacillus sp. 179-BFC.A HS]|uniref:Glycoside hydrolase family 18 protein n=1 Tax=Tigheibacillus jepli TaxID=3035914 RepID=A0ABU5CEW2_9BACI|nr:glycoside hydrolase family 18 protein [Virgibacillus sp. 179-BFC.A HS]MDY0404093.1 glycoside hydrolase family 18 protein [Virgibacillus sp. 179-BFC.A HS]
MQIHVVRQGNTASSIAGMYGTSASTIIQANELDAPNQLVVGQALVVPIVGQFYAVRPGESLFSISRKFGTTYQELARINRISPNAMLQIGQRLYIPPAPKRDITSVAYIEPSGNTVSNTLINSAQKAAPYLTYLTLFSYRVNRDGTLTAPPLDNLKAIADQNRTNLMMAITNLEEGAFSTELAHIIFSVQAVQNTLLDTIVKTAKNNGFTNIHLDFEFISPDDREAYNDFLRKAKQRFSDQGLLLSTALAPKTSATQQGLLYEAHDYHAHGEIADMVVLMTYEWGYSGGPPMAVSPIDQVRKVVEYAITEIPANKILLGQNLYGYDWTLPFVQGGPPARAVSPQRAIDIARQNNVAISFDATAQAPFFHYTDTSGSQHTVWFEDARSIQAKFNLIKELGLRGIAYWKLGLAFPQNWLLLDDNFHVVKKE